MNIFNRITNKVAIQIGSNVGDDEFFKICSEFKPSKIILIEPHISCHPALKLCYSDLPVEINYEGVAIVTDENISEIQMASATGRTEHTSVIPLKGWNTDIILTSPATTITKIFKRYNLSNVGLLYIDTEGNDARIIDSIDFNSVNIDIIVFEAWNFPADSFAEYNKLNGIDGMKYIKNKLEQVGYICDHITGDDNIVPHDNYIAYNRRNK